MSLDRPALILSDRTEASRIVVVIGADTGPDQNPGALPVWSHVSASTWAEQRYSGTGASTALGTAQEWECASRPQTAEGWLAYAAEHMALPEAVAAAGLTWADARVHPLMPHRPNADAGARITWYGRI